MMTMVGIIVMVMVVVIAALICAIGLVRLNDLPSYDSTDTGTEKVEPEKVEPEMGDVDNVEIDDEPKFK